MKFIKIILIGFFSLFTVFSVNAAENLIDAVKDTTPYGDLRLRWEQVQQKGIVNDANAATVRTRLGFKTGEYEGFSAVYEFENITILGDDDYNSTINGKTEYPVVADVKTTEINQLFLQYTGVADSNIKIGRQVIALDNHRFIGHVGWRQNNQTFDAVTITNNSITDTTLMYGFVSNVNRIFGDSSPVGDFDSKSHLINIANSSLPFGKLVAYAYLLDFSSSWVNSNETYGMYFSGTQEISDELDFKYHVEYANQSEFGDNTTDYNANYYHIAPALVYKGVTATIGYEVLGSDNGGTAFNTPLATGHKFNGWSDKFLTTPADGLEDIYIDLAYKFSGYEDKWKYINDLAVQFQYHNFKAEEGGMDYGREYDFFIKKPINKNVYVQTKLSNYETDGFSADTKKVTFDVGFTF